MKNYYDEVWDKIRSIETDEVDFILACGVDGVRNKICDWFLQSDILNDYYIENKSISFICKKYGYSKDSMPAIFREKLLTIKILLAEDGYFDDIDFGDDEIYYNYLRYKIEKNGVTFLYHNEDVSYNDLAIAMGVSARSVRSKINDDKKCIRQYLKEAGLNDKSNCFKLYLYVFEGIYKSIEDVPYKYLKMVDEFIKGDLVVANRCLRNYNYSSEGMKTYEEKCLSFKKEIINVIKNDNKSKKMRR